MARKSAPRRQTLHAVTRARPRRPEFETIEPEIDASPLPAQPPAAAAVTPRDPAGEQPLPILLAETSLWSMGVTAFLLAPMAAAAVAVAPVMLASKLLPSSFLSR